MFSNKTRTGCLCNGLLCNDMTSYDHCFDLKPCCCFQAVPESISFELTVTFKNNIVVNNDKALNKRLSTSVLQGRCAEKSLLAFYFMARVGAWCS